MHDLDQLVTVIILKDGLLKNDLQYSLEKSYPHDFVEMLSRAKKYMQMDEAFEDESMSGVSLKERKKEEPEKLQL